MRTLRTWTSTWPLGIMLKLKVSTMLVSVRPFYSVDSFS